ncbi:hypothetical protein [Streptomyces sp. NPDC058861]
MAGGIRIATLHGEIDYEETNVPRIRALTGVDAVIPCHPTPEDALNA